MSRLRAWSQLAAVTCALVAGSVTSPVTAVAGTGQPNWGVQSPAQSPVGREFAGMAYDSGRSRTVMFSGGNGGAGTTPLDDTWEWDGTSWIAFSTTPAPPAVVGPGMAYDSLRGVTVLLDNNSHTWEWNGATWVQRTTAASPPTRVWTSMVYDAARRVMVLFGGDSLGQTWTYDGNNWTNVSPATSPSARQGTAMAFDSGRGVVVLFGGRDIATGQRQNDTWEWNGVNWTQRTPATTPFPRFFHTMAYDALAGVTVTFGGDHLEASLLGPENDTWLWDGTNWTQDWTFAAPSPRAGQAMAYQSANGSIVMFGGSDELNPGTFPTDTWELGSSFVTPAGAPVAHSSVSNLNFGTVSGVGVTSGGNHLLVTNPGTGPLLISSYAIAGPFAISASSCPTAPNPLAAGAYCSLVLTYTPTVCANPPGSLTFVDNGPGGSQSIGLLGGILSSTCDSDLLLFPSNDVTAAATSPAGAVVNYQNTGWNDEDAIPSPPTCSPAPGSTFPIGTTTVTCSVSDPEDATSPISLVFHVTVTGAVADSDLALTNVPADISVNAASPLGNSVAYTPPTAVDEDATLPAVSCSPASLSLFPIGTTTVACTTTDPDDSPSTATATFHVTVNDTDLAFPRFLPSVFAGPTGPAGASVTYAMPVANDEDATPPAVSCAPVSGSIFPIGNTTVTCTANDPDDNPSSATGSFQVIVGDEDLALTNVPADISVPATSSSGATVTYASPTVVDEDPTLPAVSCLPASGSTFPVGTTTVTCTTTDIDDSLNPVSAAFRVIVTDTDLALAGMPADIVVNATTTAGATVTFTLPTATDEDGTSPVVSCSRASTGSGYAIGTTPVICTATDADDTPSSVSASFFVTVNDTDLALTGAPANVVADATTSVGTVVNYTPPVAVDEELAPSAVTCDHPSGSTFPTGVTTVTCSATDPDDSPAVASASFTVTVRDIDLKLKSPADVTAVAAGAAGAAVTYPAPVATDEEGTPAVTCDHLSGSTFPVGVTRVTCTATDPDDSPSSVSSGFFVTVVPDMSLSISVNPTTATAHTVVTTAFLVTNIGAVSRKVSVSYTVTFTNASGVTTVVAADKATVTVAPNTGVGRAFFLTIKSNSALGTYLVTVTAIDDTGSVTQTATFTVA